MHIIDPAQLTCSALGLKPLGEPAEKPFICHMSGFRHDAGTPATPFKAGSSFMDHPFLYRENPTGRLISGYVAALLSKPLMAKIYNTLITRDGAFKIGTFNFRKYVLNHLPEPPFIFACGSTMNTQHVVWKAPVSYSKDPFLVQIGPRSWPVHLSRVKNLLAAMPDPKKKPLRKTDGFLSDASSGQPNYTNLEGLPDHIHQLARTLTPGDWWAYSALSSSPEPEKPERLSL